MYIRGFLRFRRTNRMLDSMSLCDFHWFSKTLGKHVATKILLPDVGKPPFATYYLLHGLSDDHTIWARRTRIEEYVNNLPLIVVMPDGFRGFYTNNEEGPAYATYMAEELVAQVERNFPAKSSRAARAVGGLSMGGYGALRLALGYPDVYVSANSHSGALGHGGAVQLDAERTRIFGKKPAGSEHDLAFLARRCKSAGKLPKIRIDCGTEDGLLDGNRKFHAQLDALQIPHEYEEFAGAHDWGYWDVHVREAIAFHAKAMKLKRL